MRLAQAVRAQNDMGCLDAARAFGDRFGAALFEFALALLAVSDALLGASLLFLFGLFFSGLLFFCALSLLLCGFLRGLLCGCCARGIALFGLDALFFVLLFGRLRLGCVLRMGACRSVRAYGRSSRSHRPDRLSH